MGLLTGALSGPYGLLIKLAGMAVVALGIAIGGWIARGHWDQGTIAHLQDQLHQSQSNSRNLQSGLSECNASVSDLQARGAAAQKKAQMAVNDAHTAQSALAEARKRLSSVSRSKETCPAVDAIFKGAFR